MDGVDAEVIYGILGSASRMKDPEAAIVMFRVYNDWLKGFCSHYPDRQIGLACLPYGDIDAAVEEIYRCAKMGLKGWSCPAPGIWTRCGTRVEPLWKAVNDVELPLHFHTFPTTDPKAREMAEVMRRAAMFTGVTGFQMARHLAAMMGAGVFERYPNVRVAFGERDRLPYALDRMDFEYEDRFRDLMPMKPSEYWKRQCRAIPV